MQARAFSIRTITPPTRLDSRLQAGTTKILAIDVEALEAQLRKAVKGEVRFSGADRGMYASEPPTIA